jgi:hypothetical protein
MFSSLLILIHFALYEVACSALDIGPARVDVDVYMSLDHQASSTSLATAFTSTITTTPNIDAPTEYTETIQSPLHPYSRVTSYIGSAWDELHSALRDSETETEIETTNRNVPATSFTAPDTTTIAATTSPYTEPTQSPLNLYSKATSYVVSVWDELQDDASRDTETSASVVTSLAFDETTCGEKSTVHTAQSSIVDLTTYSQSAYATVTGPCDGSATASTTGPASCSSQSSNLFHSNGTDTWVWPSIVSAGPSPSTYPGSSDNNSSPIVQSGKAEGKPIVTVWVSCLVGVLILAVEA